MPYFERTRKFAAGLITVGVVFLLFAFFMLVIGHKHSMEMSFVIGAFSLVGGFALRAVAQDTDEELRGIMAALRELRDEKRES